MKYKFHIVDVFSPVPFGGNQLAVLPDASGLSAEAMQSIAREFNFAESTFVLPPIDPANTARVRIFTPKTEMPFAGHPSVGTAAVLVQTKRARPGKLTLELGVGPVDVEVERSGSRTRGRLIREGPPELRSTDASLEQLAQVLNLERTDVIKSFDASAGVPFCFVHLTDRQAVDRARLDAAAWSRYLEQSWAPQVYFFAGDLKNGGDLYARMFAPGLGVAEDPATGAACVALIGATALRQKHASGTYQLSIVQGAAMGRPSELSASASIESGTIKSLTVGGFTAPIATGVIDVPTDF